ncbi:MAG: M24 family metallopeptidase [Candidatus Micrarchaeia archaeon]
MTYTENMRGKLLKILDRANVDKVLIINTGIIDSNFLYVTGFTSGVFEDTALVIERSGETLITSALEYETAIEQKPNWMKVLKVNNGKEFESALQKSVNGKRIGINGAFLPYKYVRFIKRLGASTIIDISEEFAKTRLVKDIDELSKIKAANRIVKKAFKEIPRYFHKGVTEKEIAARFDYLMMKNGASGPSFQTIVSFDKNSALPHHMPDDTKLEPNSIVLIDAGAKYENYCSDVTRTFIFKPNKKTSKYRRIIDIYETVKNAQTLALKSVKPDVEASVPHINAESYINTAKGGIYKGTFIHSLGHSIGIDVHDGMGLSRGANFKLKPGMVFSDEPGIYIEGFGGVRIEDDVVVTENGAVVL